MNSVKLYSSFRPRTLPGKVGRHECKLTLDSGAQLCLVRPELAAEQEYTGETIRIRAYDSGVREVKLASVWIDVNQYLLKQTVAVVPSLTDEVLLGADVGGNLFDTLWELEKEESQKVLAVTWAQALRHKEQDQENARKDQLDQATPTLLEETPEQPQTEPTVEEVDRENDTFLFNIDLDNSILDDSVKDLDGLEQSISEADHLQDTEAEYADPSPVGDSLDTKELDIPIPEMQGSSDRDRLVEEQQQDDSLITSIRICADKHEQGYGYHKGVLVHEEERDGEVVLRIVVPEVRRDRILKAAHSSKMAGHYSRNKTENLLRRLFTWPNISRDIKAWCTRCLECQRAARNTIPKAPLLPLPVIHTPFKKLALDIVGPIHRTVRGYKYLLTCICLATRYVEAVPLETVDAEAVCEALLEILSRTGIPETIHTDQGSVFIGKLMTRLCEELQVEKIKTSPYHPQSNGCLERWHSTLKATLMKVGARRK